MTSSLGLADAHTPQWQTQKILGWGRERGGRRAARTRQCSNTLQEKTFFFTKLSRCQSVSQRNDKEIVTNRLTRGAEVELFRTIYNIFIYIYIYLFRTIYNYRSETYTRCQSRALQSFWEVPSFSTWRAGFETTPEIMRMSDSFGKFEVKISLTSITVFVMKDKYTKASNQLYNRSFN